MAHTNRKSTTTRTRRPLLLAVVLISLMVGRSADLSWAGFTGATRNGTNALSSGTVILADNSASTSMLNLSNLKPGDTASSCIKVTYSGSVPANVRLYASQTGTLANYVTMVVTRGSSTSAFPLCSGFSSTATSYVPNEANGVMWSNTLSAFPSSFASGVVDPNTATPTTWTSGTTVAYRIDITMQDTLSSANTNGTFGLTWEAQNT